MSCHFKNIYALIKLSFDCNFPYGGRKEADVTIDPTFNVSVLFGKRDEVR